MPITFTFYVNKQIIKPIVLYKRGIPSFHSYVHCGIHMFSDSDRNSDDKSRQLHVNTFAFHDVPCQNMQTPNFILLQFMPLKVAVEFPAANINSSVHVSLSPFDNGSEH